MPYADKEKAKQHGREYYQKNKQKWKNPDGSWVKTQSLEKTRAANNKHYHKNKERIREEVRLKRLAKREERYKECPICNKLDYLVYDHNHITNVYRDYICSSCNLAIGHSFGNIEILKNIIEYLEEHK